MTNAKAHASFQACGQYIGNPAGFVVEKLQPGKPIEPISSNRQILQLVSGCAHGADLTIAPPKIIRILASIRADDGKPVAIDVEYPGDTDPRFHGTLTVSQAHRIIGVVSICAANAKGCRTPTSATP
jgi:hypothetical protein